MFPTAFLKYVFCDIVKENIRNMCEENRDICS